MQNKNARCFFAAAVFFGLLGSLSASCFAISLYDGLKEKGPAPKATVILSNLPVLPTSLDPRIGINEAQDALASGDEILAAPPAAPLLADGKIVIKAQVVLDNPKPQAPGVSVRGALNQLEIARAQIARSPQAGGGKTREASDDLFDGAGLKTVDPEAFVQKAKGLFFPNLGSGQEAAVVFRESLRPAQPEGIPSDEDMNSRMALSPLTNPERERVVRELFIEAGAKPEEILLQDAGRGRHNIYAVKKGLTDRVVIVGGHHDKVPIVGAGTIDNWSGATMVLNLYQAMRDIQTEATFIFIAFAREEEGLIGSKFFLNSFSQEQRSKFNAMVNLDTLGVDGTYSWKNNSTEALLDLVKKVAAQGKYNLVPRDLEGGDADSSTFLRAKIAAMTLFGASPEIIFDIIHTAKDTMAAFSFAHYKNAYLLTLALLATLDHQPMGPALAI